MTIFTILLTALEFSQGMGLYTKSIGLGGRSWRPTLPDKVVAGTLNKVIQGTLWASLCFTEEWDFSLPVSTQDSHYLFTLLFRNSLWHQNHFATWDASFWCQTSQEKSSPPQEQTNLLKNFSSKKGRADAYNSLVFKIHDSWEQQEPAHQEKATVATIILRDAMFIFSLQEEKPVVKQMLLFIKYLSKVLTSC